MLVETAQIMPITQLQKTLTQTVRKISEDHQPVFIMKNNIMEAVMIPFDRYNQILAEAKSLFPVDTMKQRMHLAQRGGVDKRILIVWIAASVIAVIIFTLLIIPALLSLV